MKYNVFLEREPDGGYVATVPLLPGCVLQGDTREEALKNIREAIDVYIDSEEWQIGEIHSGISELDSGKEGKHEDVSDWLKSWGKADEKKAPR